MTKSMLTTTTRQLISDMPLLPWLICTLFVMLFVSASASGTTSPGNLDPHPYRFGPEHSQPRLGQNDKPIVYVEQSIQNIWNYRPHVYRIDAEIYQLTLQGRMTVDGRLEVAVSIPFRYLSGGILDGAIESFHGRLGVHGARRSDVPRSDLAVEFGSQKDGTEYAVLGSEGTGWSLVQPSIELTYAFPIRFVDFAAHFYTRLPLRAGSEDLTGYLPYLGLALAVGRQWGGLYTSISHSVGHVSQKEYLGHPIFDRAYSTMISFEYHTPGRRHSWWVQGITRNGYAKELTGLGDRRHQVLMGYSIRVGRDWQVEIGLLENLLRFDNTPDVGLHLGITRPLGL